jgi:hypothetical protein
MLPLNLDQEGELVSFGRPTGIQVMVRRPVGRTSQPIHSDAC